MTKRMIIISKYIFYIEAISHLFVYVPSIYADFVVVVVEGGVVLVV